MSGGTKQKLSLTLALMHDPPVLLLDEPYQGFDWRTYLAFWELTGELRRRGTATVVISHLIFERKRPRWRGVQAAGHRRHTCRGRP
jgi:ABC-2 type transport system ATP-binding protein